MFSIPSFSAHPWYEFTISTNLPRGVYETSLNIQCLPPDGVRALTADLSSNGETGTSLSGTVFDVTQGFDPGDPGANGVSGSHSDLDGFHDRVGWLGALACAFNMMVSKIPN